MAWVSLIFAGILEIFGVMMMNQLQKDRRLRNVLLLFILFVASFSLLSIALQTLPMGTAYAVWTGIGAAGGTIIGMIVYGESKDWKRIVFITMIIGAVIGLKLIS